MSRHKPYVEHGQSHEAASQNDDVDKRQRAGERFRLLIQQLMDEYVAEHDRAHGALKAARDRLGIDQGYLSQLVAKGTTRLPGAKTLANTMQRLGLKSDFFYAEFSTPPHYRDHLINPREAAPENPVFRDWLAMFPEGSRPPDDIVEYLRTARPPASIRPTEAMYTLWWQALRAGIPVDVAEQSVEATEGARQRAAERGRKVPDLRPPRSKRKPRRT